MTHNLAEYPRFAVSKNGDKPYFIGWHGNFVLPKE